jgi:hypothetical protein
MEVKKLGSGLMGEVSVWEGEVDFGGQVPLRR